MKLVQNIFLFTALISVLTISTSFIDDKEEEIKYEILAQGTTGQLIFSGGQYFTINNIFEYDEFWIHLTGSTTNKPYADLNINKIIVWGGAGKIDKITFSNQFINIYSTITKAGPPQDDHGQWLPTTTPYRLIKIPYNSNPVKCFVQVLESETKED